MARRLRGLASVGRQPRRAGAVVVAGDRVVGTVTSGNFSPMLGHGIALALLDTAVDLEVGDPVEIRQRGRGLAVTVTRIPFTTPGQWASPS